MTSVLRGSIALALSVVVTLCVTACSLETGPATTTGLTIECETLEEAAVTGAPLVQEIGIGVGDQLDLRLCTNPSTGFVWEDPTGQGAQSLELVSRALLETVGAPGTAGQEVFTFRSNGPGSTVLRFRYSQPWDGGTKGAWAIDLTVTASQ